MQTDDSFHTYCILFQRYSQQQLYDVVAAVEHYKEFVPWCQRSDICVQKPPDYLEAELEVGFKYFVERCELLLFAASVQAKG